MQWAQSGLIGGEGVLGGTILVSILSAIYFVWKFVVNARTFEAGMQRRRFESARTARYEAGLWQQRCADLEYVLRQRGVPIPPLSKELSIFVDTPASDGPMLSTPWDGQEQASADERPGP